jgi:hypothetical protein
MQKPQSKACEPHQKMRPSIPLIAAFALSACATSPSDVQSPATPAESGFSSLTLIPVDNPAFAWRALTERFPSALLVWSVEESAVRDACGAREPRNDGKESASAVLAPSANQEVQWKPALDDARIEAALQRHVRIHAQSARRPFYADSERRGSEPAWRCFRFARFTNRDDAEPVFDLIGELRLGDSGDYVQLRPLRLYAGATGQSSRIAVGLQVEAVWRQENLGRRATVFEPVLLAAALTGNTDEALYFEDLYWERYPILPLPPMSIDARGRPTLTAPATVTVSLVEILSPEEAGSVLLQPARAASDHVGALIAAGLLAQ